MSVPVVSIMPSSPHTTSQALWPIRLHLKERHEESETNKLVLPSAFASECAPFENAWCVDGFVKLQNLGGTWPTTPARSARCGPSRSFPGEALRRSCAGPFEP